MHIALGIAIILMARNLSLSPSLLGIAWYACQNFNLGMLLTCENDMDN
jgi:hypothetical protein